MVYIPRELAAYILRPDCTCLNAYINAPISQDALDKLKSRLEHGAALRYHPQVEFKIQHAPSDYIGKSHSDIRKKEDQAGREQPFLLIDERAETDGAVWYVGTFAREFELDDDGTGFAASSTEALHEVLVRASMVAWMHVDTEVSPGPSEQLVHSVFKNYRTPVNEWPEIAGVREEELARADVAQCRLFHAGSGRCVAEPGEFEERKDEQILDSMGGPRPEVVARLKPDIAKANGLVSVWKRITPVKQFQPKDGVAKVFPEGSVWLDVEFDTKFDWPEYKWPEGSL